MDKFLIDSLTCFWIHFSYKCSYYSHKKAKFYNSIFGEYATTYLKLILIRLQACFSFCSFQGWDAAISGTFKNTGHSLQFTPESSKAMLTTPHGRFVFKQFHFHWGISSDEGSEHCVDGFSFATEIHFVHEKTEDSDDSLAVIGILCHANEISNGTQHWEEVVVPQEAGEVARVDNVKMCNYLTHDLDYYHYKGSLTTPPFTENVLWYVVKQPLHIPEQLLLKLRQMKDFEGQMLTSNHRQCMPLHNRIVETPRLI